MGAVLLALTGCSSHGSSGSASSPAHAIPEAQASRSHCGQGWSHAASGTVQVKVRNTDVNAEEVYLADTTGKVYGEVDPLAPGTTAMLTTSLAAGTYHLVCSVNDGSPVHGPKVSVTGDAPGVRGVEPVTSADLAPKVIAYQHWVEGRLVVLEKQAVTLAGAIQAGDRGRAQAAWRSANRTWNTMGGAYDAFGDLGDAIAGNAYPYPKGVHDPRWKGLLRIEYGLWHDQPTSSLTKLSGTLQQDLKALGKELKGTQFQPLDVVNRTHEITEDTLQQTLTGHDDYGAHVELSDALAQLDGTTKLLSVLHPLLQPRYPQLPQVNAWITKSRNDIRAQHGWTVTPVDGVATAAHRRIDSDFAQLTELLTPVPTMLEPRVF